VNDDEFSVAVEFIIELFLEFDASLNRRLFF